MKWFNPLTWSTLALQIVGGCLLAIVLFWYIDKKLDDHYTVKQQEAVKTAAVAADLKIAKRKADNDKKAKEAANAKIKTLESNLAAATSTAQSRGGLLDDIRGIQIRTANSATACSQYSATLGELLASGTELAGRIAKEADGHAADSLECRKAWPE